MTGRSKYSRSNGWAVFRGVLGCIAVACTTALAPSCGKSAGSTDGGNSVDCESGATRECTGPGACKGGQQCGLDHHWGNCQCGDGGKGGAAGTSDAGSSGDAGLGGTTGGTGAVSGVGGNAGSSGGVGASSGTAGEGTGGASGGDGGSAGSAGASGSGGDAGSGGSDGQAACDLELTQVAAYQAVKIELMRDLLAVPPADRGAQLVTGRDLFVRAFVDTPATGWVPKTINAVLKVKTAGQVVEFVQSHEVGTWSKDADLATTFNFNVPANLVAEDLAYSVALLQDEPCVGATEKSRFPAAGFEVPEGVVTTGPLHVVLVPLQVNNSALPDMSEERTARFRDIVHTFWPATSVELTWRKTSVTVPTTKLPEAAEAVRQVREADAPGPEVHYHGFFGPPGDTVPCEFEECFCPEGASAIVGASASASRGYEDAAAFCIPQALAIGYGSPEPGCAIELEAWGYVPLTGELLDPNLTQDISAQGECLRRVWWHRPIYQQMIAAFPWEVTARPLRSGASHLLE